MKNKKAQTMMLYIATAGYIVSVLIILFFSYQTIELNNGTETLTTFQTASKANMAYLKEELQIRSQIYEIIQNYTAKAGQEKPKAFNKNSVIEFDIIKELKEKLENPHRKITIKEENGYLEIQIKANSKKSIIASAPNNMAIQILYEPSYKIKITSPIQFFKDVKKRLIEAKQCTDGSCITDIFATLGFDSCRENLAVDEYCMQSTVKIPQKVKNEIIESPIIFKFKYNMTEQINKVSQSTQPTKEIVNSETPIKEVVQKPQIKVDSTQLGKIFKYDIGEMRSNKIKYIILHHTGSENALATARYMNEKKLSIHYMVDRDGTIYYLFDEKYRASHSGCCNDNSCLIKCQDSSPIVGSPNDMSIGIEIVNYAQNEQEYTQEQYESISSLIKDIASRYELISYDDEHILGHYEVSAWKWDPSPAFDWSKIGLPEHTTLAKLNKCSAAHEYGFRECINFG